MRWLRQHRRGLAWWFLVIVVAVVFGAQGYQIKENAKTHEALCLLRADLQDRIDRSEEFLDMTVAERVERYGPVLGKIDPDTIRAQVPGQRRTVEALHILDCP